MPYNENVVQKTDVWKLVTESFMNALFNKVPYFIY